jgi:tetratricopeptide (TPR) repeat protein
VSEQTRAFRLDDVRADGWFERLGEGSPAFEQLCEVVGPRFVAFAVVAGVRISSVSVDARSADASMVEFTLGEGGPGQRLALGEFRRRLAAALLSEEEPHRHLPERPRTDDLTAFIGFRWVLLSAIFGIKLRELRMGPHGRADVLVDLGGTPDELGVHELREAIRDRIRAEAQKARPPSPFAIDLNVVPDVLRAEEESAHERVIDLIGAWPGPLSMLLRTAEGQSLSPEVRATLARALGVLGSAYVSVGRVDWAQEVLRLGIQWGQDGPWAGDLFRRLADAHASRGRHGEAIGLFRRAIQLGAPRREVLPQLAASFAARQRHLAAMACVEAAIADGASEASVLAVREEALGALGEAWARFRQHVA